MPVRMFLKMTGEIYIINQGNLKCKIQKSELLLNFAFISFFSSDHNPVTDRKKDILNPRIILDHFVEIFQ